ncbi:hypothetical protein [Armatimonas sp.]|uniref:hypothetical protein n=1 Tax=Armatimonas sp. TaxID=1872638 RepID=UPI00286B62CF|nr:hypothetical protein [Armatimonas sp.]
MKVYRRSLATGFLGALIFSSSISAQAQSETLTLPATEQSFLDVLLQVHKQTGRALVVEGIPREKTLKLATGPLPQVLDTLAREFDFTWSDENGILVFVQQFKRPESTPEISADEFAASLRDILKLGAALDAAPAQTSFTRSLQSFVLTLPQPQQALLNATGLPLHQLSPEHRKQFEALLFQRSFSSILFKANQLEQTLSALPTATLQLATLGVIWVNRDLPKSRGAISPYLGKSRPIASPAWPQESPEQPALITWERFTQTLSTTTGLRVTPELTQHPAFFIAKEPTLPLLRALVKCNGWQLQRRGEGEKQEILLRRPALPTVTRESLGKAIFQTLPTSIQRYLSARYPEDTINPRYPDLPPSMGKIMSDLMQKSNSRLQKGYEVVAKALGDKESLRVANLTPVQKVGLTDTLIFRELEQIGDALLGKAVAHNFQQKPDLAAAILSSTSGGSGFELRYADGSGFIIRTRIHVPSPGR